MHDVGEELVTQGLQVQMEDGWRCKISEYHACASTATFPNMFHRSKSADARVKSCHVPLIVKDNVWLAGFVEVVRRCM